MENWFKLPEDERKEIIRQTSIKTNLPEAAVEKDLWVMIVLRAVFNTEYAPHLVFKGGTSLSKAWGIIDRFSEDIDLAMDRTFFGYGGDLSQTQVKKLRKASCEFVSKTFIKDLLIELKKLTVENIEVKTLDFEESDTDPLAIEISYKSVTEKIQYLKPRILLEISSRSLREPFEIKTLRSHIKETFPDKDFSDKLIDIPYVTPTRTFIEKMFLLHEEFQKPKDKKIRSDRMTRHLYDIDKLSETDYLQKAIDDHELYFAIIQHRQSMTRIRYVNYESHNHKSLNFTPPSHVIKEWEKDFNEMKESMFRNESRTFDELLSKIKEINTIFNNINY